MRLWYNLPHRLNCVRTVLNNNTFQLKMLLFFVQLRSQQKRTEKVISSYQIYSVAISTLLF